MNRLAAMLFGALVAGGATPPAAGSSAAAPIAARISGLHPEDFDRSVRPADDLYRFATGGWAERTAIPPDRASWGTLAMLGARAGEDVHALLEELAADPPPAGTDARRIADLYRSFMDGAPGGRPGAGALAPERARIAALRTARDLAAWLGAAQRLGFTTGLDSVRVGLDAPVDFAVQPDRRDSSRYAVYLSQAGLTLPDRNDYLGNGPRGRRLRDALRAYAERLLAAAHEPHAAARARRILRFETRLARAQWTPVRNRDPVRTYNPMTPAQLERMAPGLRWRSFLAAAGVVPPRVVVEQPGYFRALGRLARQATMADWRGWLTFKLLDGYAAALPPPFADLAFGFHSRTLLGIAEPAPRWRRAVELLDLEMGEAVGREYVARHFSPGAKAQVATLVANLQRAFDASLEELDWMGPQTRGEARRKLARMTVRVGYPDRWSAGSDVALSPHDLPGNLRLLAAAHHARAVGRVGGPVDRDEWLISPQTVNAYYDVAANEIVLPAAFLQPPLYDPAADDAVNYGALGGAIGHEISHAFDDRGRRYDAEGNLRDWWTAADAARFETRAAALVAQYSALTPAGGGRVNGQLTLGENIGDLSGLAVAWQAWRIALEGRASPVLDGFTGEQRFFLGWACVFRFRIRDEALREFLAVNSHSPPEFRVNAVVRNLEPFHAAFDVGPGDRMYRAPGDRVKIW